MIIQPIINNKYFRFIILVVAALLGVIMSDCTVYAIDSLYEWFWDGNTLDGAVLKWLKLVVVGLPVFLALWWFRTSDTRQQIEKSQAQIEQNSFVSGMQHLVSEKPLQVEIGTHILLEVSKNTSEFNTHIRLAFIRRLKETLTRGPTPHTIDASIYKFSYASHIIKWLKNNSDAGSMNLNGVILINQDFTSNGADIKFADIVDLHDFKKYGDPPNIIMQSCHFTDADSFFAGHEKVRGKYSRSEDIATTMTRR